MLKMTFQLLIVRCFCFVLLIFAAIRASNLGATNNAVLEIGLHNASSYVAFSGDFDVIYSLPDDYSLASGLFIRILSLRPKRRVLETMNLPRGARSAEVTINCGVIDSAGEVQFQLVDSLNRSLAETASLSVRWPPVTLAIPPTHVALSDEVALTITVTGMVCRSFNPDTRYRVEVVYLGRNDTRDSEPEQTIHEALFRHLLLDVEVILSCALFDREGVYQASVRADGNPVPPIAVSNEMRVSKSADYRLSADAADSAAAAVFPCAKAMSVRYAQPRCSAGRADDKIRLFQRLRAGPGAPSTADLRYITERRAGGGTSAGGSVSFECGYFSERSIGYCFQYVSTANSGAVSEQIMLCLPTTSVSGTSIDGVWSDWSNWSKCAGSCRSSVQTRFRTCDSPTMTTTSTTRRRSICTGSDREIKACLINCSGPSFAPTAISQPTEEQNCQCSCTLRDPNGASVSYDPNRCRDAVVVWSIVTSPERVIELTYLLRASDRSRRLRITEAQGGESNGGRATTTTTAPLRDETFAASKTETVRSTKNSVNIEIYKSTTNTEDEGEEGEDGEEEEEETLFVTYTTLLAASNDSSLLQEKTAGGDWMTSWRSFTLICVVVVVVLCVAMTIVLIIFCCRRHIVGLRSQVQKSPVGKALLRRRNDDDAAAGEESCRRRGDQGSTRDGPNPYHSFAETTTPPESPSRGYLLTRAAFYHHDSSSHPDVNVVQKFQPDGKGVRGVLHEGEGLESSVDGNVCPSPSRNSSVVQCSDHCPTGSPNLPFRPGQGQGPSSEDRRNNGDRRQFSVAPLRKSKTSSISPPPAFSPASDRAAPVRGGTDTTTRDPSKEAQRDRKRSSSGQCCRRQPGEGSCQNVQTIGIIQPPVSNKNNTSASASSAASKMLSSVAVADRNQTQGAETFGGREGSRGAVRPDGQSPEDPKAEKTPSIVRTPPSLSARSAAAAADESPSIGGTSSRLFPDAVSVNTLSDIGSQDGLEYDDYVLQLPGSFFNMDPQAYTLTWSKPPASLPSQKRIFDGEGKGREGGGGGGGGRPSVAQISSFSGSDASIGS